MKRLNKINLVYYDSETPKYTYNSIFLAGPTLRPDQQHLHNWRIDAIEYLKKKGYKGIVYIPEYEGNGKKLEYNEIIEWEKDKLDKADAILFYIPRDLKNNVLALTTNIEFGMYLKCGKIFVGAPKDADKTEYIQYKCKENKIDFFDNLNDEIDAILNYFNNYSLEQSYRIDAEIYIPLNIWTLDSFQGWYKSQLDVGNELRFANLDYVFIMPKARKVFLWILKVHMWVKSENRIKDNEFVLCRNDICSAMLYHLNDNILDTEIVLIKEFRSPVNNSESFVYELPSGSSIKIEENIDVIAGEIKEECGIDVDKNRIQYECERQVISTLSAHKNHLYSVELNDDETNGIEKLIEALEDNEDVVDWYGNF
jgi:hypothetical protein